MTQEILGKMDERRLARSDPIKYKQLNKEIRKIYRKDRKNFLRNVLRKLKSWKRKICRLYMKKLYMTLYTKKEEEFDMLY